MLPSIRDNCSWQFAGPAAQDMRAIKQPSPIPLRAASGMHFLAAAAKQTNTPFSLFMETLSARLLHVAHSLDREVCN